MQKVFIRTIHEDGSIEVSFYDRRGRRYIHRKRVCVTWNGLSPKETDDVYGHMAYARMKGFRIIDNFQGKHPKRIKKDFGLAAQGPE